MSTLVPPEVIEKHIQNEFMFQVTQDEDKLLRSQIVTLKKVGGLKTIV
jgi:hypothetical protein